MLAPAAAFAAPTRQAERGALAVSATVVPSCEVTLTADVSRVAAIRPGPGQQLAVSSCTPGTAPQLGVERAAPEQPSAGTAVANGTLYVTLTY